MSEITASDGAGVQRSRLSPTRRGVLVGGTATAVMLAPLAVPSLTGVDVARLTSGVLPRSAGNQLEPILAAARERNLAAVNATVARIDVIFAGYKQRLVGFVEEIYTFTRLAKLAGLSVTDWFTGENWAGESVERLFERHVFTEDKFKADLAAALASFQHALRADSNAVLLADIEGMGAQSDFTLDNALTRDRFAELVFSHATDAARPETRTMTVEILTTGAVVTLAAMVGARLAASLAARAAAVGGGAAIGSWAPVVGTIVGAVVGFLADALVQHWVEDTAKEQMIADLGLKLDQVRNHLIEGTPAGTGLRKDLETAAQTFTWAQHSAVESLVSRA